MFAILALVWTRSVKIPACAPEIETALAPRVFTAIAIKAQAALSPVASKTSSSRFVGLGETSCASLINWSVSPAMAEMTATTRQPSRCVSTRRAATLRIRSGLPTEVPPYFWTIRRMESLCTSKNQTRWAFRPNIGAVNRLTDQSLFARPWDLQRPARDRQFLWRARPGLSSRVR